MNVIQEEGSRPIKAWVEKRADGTLNIEDSALVQLKNLARLPFIAGNGVAVMPDVHAGIGSTVGTVIATDRAIIPAAVGVDIGCGMNAVRLSLRADQLPDSLAKIRSAIEAAVPLGAGGNRPESQWNAQGVLNIVRNAPALSLADVDDPDRFMKKAASQLGSLGSGNHFIELCVDESDQVWVMLHSGSRGVGNMIGKHYIEQAKRNMEKFFITLPHQDLAYFPEDTDDFDRYVAAVQWAQDYALENRRVMMLAVLQALKDGGMPEFTLTSEAVNCHHNYVEKENHFGKNIWVTRKGAVRAREGDLGIIPGSMGQRSFIVRGKGNPQSYCSCSHGAGRQMSRSEARRRFSLTDLIEQTQGVECRKDDAVLDEIPGSYKSLDQVMANQSDLIEVIHTLKAVLCVKGA